MSGSKWDGLTEPQDFITCLECGFRGKSLATHLKVHGMNGASYRAKHGSEVLLRCLASEAKRRSGIKKAHQKTPAKTRTKECPCTECGEVVTVSAFTSAAVVVCPSCVQAKEDARWEGLSEPEDYVTCRECGHRAVILTSHFQNAHPSYREDHPEAPIVALNAKTRDKTALRGKKLSAETRAKMSENAGRWNKGLTKEDHPSLARQAAKMREKVPWNRGLTATGPAADPRLSGMIEKLKTYIGENRPWHNGLRADLTLDDFAPVLDAEGRVDRQKAKDLLGFSWNTVAKYMETYGLEVSDVNVQARAEAQTIRLTEEDLDPYRLKNGKVSIGAAAKGLGRYVEVVRREVKRLGLPVARGRVKQGLCLQAVSEALGGVTWEEEWKDRRFTNPKTGWRYRYDGYFREVGLVVEFHGHQHFVYPNAFHKTEADYLALRERDRHKADLIRSAEGLIYFMVRYDEPFTDASYLRGRLVGAGVLAPGSQGYPLTPLPGL